ncbi:rod shape-determining protein MreD [Cognatishimia activa]|uniref:rod shape-determining protein MreD n=1 Tax=Cognatishimia activa TaxID=1715691 RepID=UPI00222FEA90|nr:rod shape-determining protein MreD [Cognatishimia activa]UZD90100.1 rod shape-determining protein MreD [Cognatishimia activa]
MAETNSAKPWIMRGTFAALAIGLLFWSLLPLNTVPRNWTGPDLLMVLTMVWVLRRPDYAPAFLIAAVILLADFLLGRPPGLLAAITVFVCDNLRRRAMNRSEMVFSVEWLTAAAALTVIAVANRLLTAVFILEQAPLTLTLVQLVASILVYPLVAGFCSLILGVRQTRFREGDPT